MEVFMVEKQNELPNEMQKELNEETRHLSHVRQKIGEQIDLGTELLGKKKAELLEFRRYEWEELGHTKSALLDSQEEVTGLIDLQRQEYEYDRLTTTLARLGELYRSAYFARIDFKEDGTEEPEKIYIGRFSVIDGENGDILVYDWRSPISSIFYDFEYGPAYYDCPDGKIEGELSLKRQYLIEGPKIVSMFDSSVAIRDKILQEILSKNSEEKMKTIVTTIQREQNFAIRDERSRVLVVSGNAGSGKTSIALHRISYLMYRHREQLNEKNVVIFSPNNVFSEYISDVLPSLGEKNAVEMTLEEMLDRIGHGRQSFYDYMESLLNGEISPEHREIIRRKCSETFAAALEDFVKNLDGSSLGFRDVGDEDGAIITAEEIAGYFRQFKALSVTSRIKKIRSVFYARLLSQRKEGVEKLKQTLVEQKGSEYFLNARDLTLNARYQWHLRFKKLEHAYNASNTFSAEKLYSMFLNSFFGGEAAAQFTKTAAEDRLYYEDTAPLAYLKLLLGEEKPDREIRLVVIDEAQDYSPVQFRLLGASFPSAGFTIVGDQSQTVNPLNPEDSLAALPRVFSGKKTGMLELHRSYRSTVEINRYACALLGRPCFDCIDRHGEEPLELIYGSDAEKAALICGRISEINKNGRLTAVITKSKDQAKSVYYAIKDKLHASLVSGRGGGYAKNTVLVMPSYLAKGLEFDNVIVDAGEKGNFDPHLLYVSCTRALHNLTVLKAKD